MKEVRPVSGRYTVIPSPELDVLLDSALAEIAQDLRKTWTGGRLVCVLLGGGYGRGEGGVLHTESGDRLYNDLDFFVFTRNAGRRTRQEIDRQLHAVGERWEKKLGVAVDFSPAKNLDDIPRVGRTLMFQELRHGWKPVLGNASIPVQLIPELNPAHLPYTEAVRLLLNRGMGLIFAGERLAAGRGEEEADFVVRNMNKAVLGSGDALLLAAGRYCWKGEDRVREFSRFAEESGLPPNFAGAYAAAFRYKIEPHPVLPPDPRACWLECRKLYLDAVRRVAETEPGSKIDEVKAGIRRRAADRRSVKNFLRWLVRAKSVRPAGCLTEDPVVTVLCGVFELLETGGEYPACPRKLYDLWSKFN